MHDVHRVARAHRQVYARQRDGDDDPVTRRTTQTTVKAAATTPATTRTTAAATTPPTTTARAVTTPATSVTPLINISSLLGISSIPNILSLSSPTTSSSLPSTTSSSSTTTQPTTSASSTTHQQSTLTATETASNTAAAASSTESATAHSGLSGAATGGIIAGAVLAGLGLLIFAIRKTFIRRRQRKRNTWGAGVYPDINDKFYDGTADLPPPLPEKAPSTGYLEPRTPIWAAPRPVSPNPSHAAPPPPANYYVQPPQPSYNNAMMDAAPVVAPASITTGSFGAQSAPGEVATVRVLYIPTLPDELQITTGEMVHIIKAYDDGWALCSNGRGEQGVVPLECLDRTGQGQRLSVGNGQQHEAGGDWRNMKRMSSLSTQ